MDAAPATPSRRRRPFLWGTILLVVGAVPWTGLMVWAFLDDAKQGYSRTAEMILQIGLVWLLGVALMAVAIYPFVFLLSWLVGKFARRTS
jgi:hypothetical protein